MVDPEKVRKRLGHFPGGVYAIALAQELKVGKTTVYEALNKLRESGEAYNKHHLWFPKKTVVEQKPSSGDWKTKVRKEVDKAWQAWKKGNCEEVLRSAVHILLVNPNLLNAFMPLISIFVSKQNEISRNFLSEKTRMDSLRGLFALSMLLRFEEVLSDQTHLLEHDLPLDALAKLDLKELQVDISKILKQSYSI